MQTNITSQPNRSAAGRNTSNQKAVAVRKANNVKNVNKKSVKKRATNLRAVRSLSVIDVKNKEKAPFPWSVVVTAILFTCLFLFMMMNYAEVDKYRSEIADLDSDIATLEKQQNDLQVTLSNKYDLKEIGDYATDVLGMVPSNQINDRHVITIEQNDKTEMYNYEEEEDDGLGFLLTGFGEIFKDFIK